MTTQTEAALRNFVAQDDGGASERIQAVTIDDALKAMHDWMSTGHFDDLDEPMQYEATLFEIIEAHDGTEERVIVGHGGMTVGGRAR